MAAIFQLRRGTTGDKPTLANGEMYVNTTSASLQVGIDTGNEVTLVKLNDDNIGSLKLNGLISTSADITASNAYFSGNVAISGNLFLGNNTSDNIAALGVFTTNLVPGTNNTYDIGTNSAKWSVVYANSLSGSLTGSVNGINITTFSESVDSRLDTLESTSTGYTNRLNSLEARSASVETKFSTLSTYTSSVETKASTLATYTASVETKASTLATYTASIETKFSTLQTLTSSNSSRLTSLETFTGSQNTKFSTLQNVTSSILSYTASLNNAISLNGNSVTILGDLTVLGDTTTLNTSELLIEDKTLTIASGSLTSAAANGAGLIISGANVSMSWDHTNTRLAFNTNISALGSISSSTIIGLNGVSVTTYSTSVDSRLVALEGTGTTSTNRLNNLEARSASVETKLSTLQNVTSSILSWTSSQDIKNTALANHTGSTITKFTTLENVTSSVLAFSSSLKTWTGSIHTYTASLETKATTLATYTSSVETKATTLQTYTSSVETKANTLQTYTSSLETKFSVLQGVTASLMNATQSFNTWTGSVFEPFSTSVDMRLDDLRYDVNLLTPAGLSAAFDALNAFTGTAALTSSFNAFTSSTNIKFSTLENVTSSVLSWTGSQNTKNSTLATYTGSIETKATTLENVTASLIAATSSYETKGRGIISSSAQLTATLPAGVVSGSAQVSGSIFSTISGDITIATNGVATIQANSVTLGVDTTGNYMSDLTQGTGVTITHTPGEGSNATIAIGQAVATSSNVQFASIGVGTAASGVSGEIRATGDITAYYSSDERLKFGIVPIENALSKVESISGNRYHWKEGFENIHSHKGADLGVIAQEVQSVLPEVVTERETGYLAVDYVKLVPVLIEAIKELSAKIDRLENK